MSKQRWGTFSVRDHLDPHPFAADVLLYDRLIIPYPSDDEELVEWSVNGWDPDRLHALLRVLRADGVEEKRHAIQVPWNARTRDLFNRRAATAGVVNQEASYGLTRRLLAEELLPAAAPGVTRVEVLAAYPSIEAAQEEWQQNSNSAKRETLTFAIAHQLLVPDPKGKSDIELLQEAIDLADDAEFKRKRAQMYKWQDEVIRDGISNATAIQEMAQYVEEYNAVTKKAVKKVYNKFAFTLIPIALTALGGPLAPAAAFVGIASLIRFWIYDRKPTIEAGDSQVAAMLHTVQEELGWRLAGPGES